MKQVVACITRKLCPDWVHILAEPSKRDCPDRPTDHSGLSKLTAYNANSQVTNLTDKQGGTTKQIMTFSYDGNGSRTVVSNASNLTTYGYDAVDRLISDTTSGANAHSYTYSYDPVSNRLSDSELGSVRGWTYDAANMLEVMTTGGVTTFFSYDVNGNFNGTSVGGVFTVTMTHDNMNRLVQYWDGSTLTRYTYDGDGLKRTEQSGSTTTTLIWDGSEYLQGRK